MVSLPTFRKYEQVAGFWDMVLWVSLDYVRG